MSRIALWAVAGAVAATSLTACSTSGRQVAAGAPAASGSGTLDLHTISTVGTGKMSTTPDEATVTLGVSTKRATATDALNANNAEAHTLIQKLRSGGVAEKDIQTTELSIYPNYTNAGHIDGYQVSNTVTATMHDLKKAGAIIDSAASAVGDDVRVQGISFGLSDDTNARAQARVDAVKQAKAQAEQIARAAGVSLGTVRTIAEESSESPTPMYQGTAAMNAMASTPIAAGQVSLTVSVSVTYDIG